MSVEVKWGEDIVKYGADNVLYGREILRFMADETLFGFGISAEYPDDPDAPDDANTYHVWTGYADLTVGGITYTAVGPDVLEVGSQRASLQGQGRMSIVLSAIEVEHRNLFLQDPGRVRITLRMLYSTDGGVNWRVIPRSHSGYLSRPQLEGGRYTLEIAVYRDETNRGFSENWSDASQQSDFPGDRGLEHMATLAAPGLDIRWP